MSICPAGPRLSVVDPPAEDETKLILPPGVSGPAVGIVVAVGQCPGLGVEVGDKVFYHAGHSTAIEDVKIIAAECVVAFDDGGRTY